MKLFKQERLGILEGLLFAVGDEGVSLEQLEYVIDVNEVEVKSLILDLKDRYYAQRRHRKPNHQL